MKDKWRIIENKWRTIDKLQKEKLPKIWKLLNKWRTIDELQKKKLPKIRKQPNKWRIIGRLQKNLPTNSGEGCCSSTWWRAI